MPGISEAALSKLEPPVPSLDAQQEVVCELEKVLEAIAIAKEHVAKSASLRTSLVEAVS